MKRALFAEAERRKLEVKNKIQVVKSIVGKRNSWLVRKCKGNVNYRILCIPYAGGGPASFGCWTQNLPANVELAIAHLPGRDSRFGEPAPSSIDEIVEAICSELDYIDAKPFVLYGHSLGAAIAYEISIYLQAKGRLRPIALFVSGRVAPHAKTDRPDIHKLEYDAFKDKIREYNGTPSEILENDEVFSVFENTLRSDFMLSETYYRSHPNERKQLNCPIIAYCGSTDSEASAAKMEEWRRYSDDFRIHCLHGGHFFIFEHGHTILNDMQSIFVAHEQNRLGDRVFFS